MRKSIIFITVFLFSVNLFSFTLDKVLEIGNEENEKYTFFSIGDITADEDGNIYVFDNKGYVLRKYNRRGKFLGQTGKKGKGPGDFSSPSSLSYYGDRIFVFDQGNNRIAVYDKKLRLISYINSKNFPLLGSQSFFVFGKRIYLKSPLSSKGGRISILDFKGKLIKQFFDKYPSYLEDWKEVKGYKKRIFLSMYSSPIFAFNREKKEIAIMFFYPESEMKIFLYDSSGNFINTHTTYLIKGFKVPDCMKTLSPMKCLDKEKYSIGSLAFSKDYLFISYFKFVKGEKRGILFFAIYNIKDRKIIKNKKGVFYILYHASENKLYVSNEDNDKVIVLKIEG